MAHGADSQEVTLMSLAVLFPDFKQLSTGLSCCGYNWIYSSGTDNMLDGFFPTNDMAILVDHWRILGEGALSDDERHTFSRF